MNKNLISRVYGVSRTALYDWVRNGTIYDEAAKHGFGLYYNHTAAIVGAVKPERFDDLSKFPPNNISEVEKEWFRIVFSKPGGPVIDPRPRKGAIKGVYYDEKKQRWKKRPYITISD